MELWELEAREEIRHTIATYSHSGDRMFIEELAATFTEDGVLEVKGLEPAVGRAAIVAFLGLGRESSAEPKGEVAEALAHPRGYVRHNVTNIRFDSLTRDEARVSSYFFVVTPIGPDHWGRYRDRLVPVDGRWLFAHRLVAVDGHAEASTFPRFR